MCFRIKAKKDPMTGAIAAATLRQIVVAVFERVELEDRQAESDNPGVLIPYVYRVGVWYTFTVWGCGIRELCGCGIRVLCGGAAYVYCVGGWHTCIVWGCGIVAVLPSSSCCSDCRPRSD